MSPRGAPRTDARLQRDAAVITAPASNVAPNDAVAVDRFDGAARLMSRDDRQRIAVPQRTMPAVHIGAAKLEAVIFTNKAPGSRGSGMGTL